MYMCVNVTAFGTTGFADLPLHLINLNLTPYSFYSPEILEDIISLTEPSSLFARGIKRITIVGG